MWTRTRVRGHAEMVHVVPCVRQGRGPRMKRGSWGREGEEGRAEQPADKGREGGLKDECRIQRGKISAVRTRSDCMSA